MHLEFFRRLLTESTRQREIVEILYPETLAQVFQLVVDKIPLDHVVDTTALIHPNLFEDLYEIISYFCPSTVNSELEEIKHRYTMDLPTAQAILAQDSSPPTQNVQLSLRKSTESAKSITAKMSNDSILNAFGTAEDVIRYIKFCHQELLSVAMSLDELKLSSYRSHNSLLIYQISEALERHRTWLQEQLNQIEKAILALPLLVARSLESSWEFSNLIKIFRCN